MLPAALSCYFYYTLPVTASLVRTNERATIDAMV